jgi:hypothetical protein
MNVSYVINKYSNDGSRVGNLVYLCSSPVDLKDESKERSHG